VPSGTYAVLVTEGRLIIAIRYYMGFLSLSMPVQQVRITAESTRVAGPCVTLLPKMRASPTLSGESAGHRAAMPERERMRPMKRNVLLTITSAIMICALAAAAAGFTLTGRASPARQSVTCCTTARPTVQHGTGVTWISRGVQERQRAGTASGALRQISVPYLRLLGGGVVGSLPGADGPIPARTGHISHNWWPEGGACVSSRGGPCAVPTRVPGHRHHLARHRRPPPHQHGSPPRTLRRSHIKTEKNGARTRPGALAEGH